MIVKELGNLLQMLVCQRVDILPQLVQSELGVRFAVRMVKDSHQLPDNMAEAVHKTRILAFQGCKSLLVLSSEIAGLLGGSNACSTTAWPVPGMLHPAGLPRSP
jgi:hypothetical protein